MSGAPNPGSISTKLEQIAKRAKEMPGVAFNTLAHHIDIEWLREAYQRTRKDGAVGVDGQSAAEYAVKLEENLRSLLDRAKSGDGYRAPAVRRVHIPKGDGSKTRPIGIPTFEDKVLQRAVVMVLEAVYEQDFYDCSHSFRPGRSAHDALRALRERLMEMNGGWVLEADIEKFFDSVDRAQLQEILRRRVRDGVLHRLIGKWLNAGVMEEGRVYRPDAGTPQGGVISPLLANIYLHEVLDEWFAREVKPRLRGRVHLVRYADDFVIAFEQEEDARRVMDVLPKRFGKYGLRLHPEKTRLVRFNRPSRNVPPRDDAAAPESFDLLGFTHYWRRSRQGNWVVYRKTAGSRLSRALRATAQWLRRNRHEPIEEQHRVLVLKLRGHYSYYGIIGNFAALDSFRSWAREQWCKWLSRRSRASPGPTAMGVLLEAYPLPRPRITHAV
jgi:group II intron reverse transcriptase/maturase